MSTTPLVYPRRTSLGATPSTPTSPHSPYHPSAKFSTARTPLGPCLIAVPAVALCPPSPLRVATPPRGRPPIAASAVGASPVRLPPPPSPPPRAGGDDDDGPRLSALGRPTAVLRETPAASARPPRTFSFLTPPGLEVSPVKVVDKERSDEWSVSSAALSSSVGSSLGGWGMRKLGGEAKRAWVDVMSMSASAASPRHISPAPKAKVPTSLSASRATLRSFADEWLDKSTHSPHYGEGGYLGATCGVLLNHRYTLLEKLGWGEFSTVWLARDALAASSDTSYVAVKVARCSQTVSASTRYEVSLLKHLRSAFGSSKTRRRVAMTPLIDAFEHRGAHGTHACVVLPTFGPNLLCVIDTLKRRRRRLGVPEIQMLKHVIRNIAAALSDLESVAVLHTDLKPENVLLAFPHPRLAKNMQRTGRLSSEEAEKLSSCGDQRHAVVLADFGLSVLMDPDSPVGQKPSFKIVQRGRVLNSSGTLIQTREYRAPEVIVGSDFECRTDVWSLGCMMYELFTGDFLFDPKRKTRVERDMDIEHLGMIMQVHGPMSFATMARGSTASPRYASRYFAADDTFLYADKFAAYPRRNLEAELSPYIGTQEAVAAAELISACIQYNPSDRPHAADVINHPWLQGSCPDSLP